MSPMALKGIISNVHGTCYQMSTCNIVCVSIHQITPLYNLLSQLDSTLVDLNSVVCTLMFNEQCTLEHLMQWQMFLILSLVRSFK